MKPVIYRVISAIVLLYFSLARLSETGSYLQAIGAACLFYAIWWLGLNSRHKDSKGQS